MMLCFALRSGNFVGYIQSIVTTDRRLMYEAYCGVCDSGKKQTSYAERLRIRRKYQEQHQRWRMCCTMRWCFCLKGMSSLKMYLKFLGNASLNLGSRRSKAVESDLLNCCICKNFNDSTALIIELFLYIAKSEINCIVLLYIAKSEINCIVLFM